MKKSHNTITAFLLITALLLSGCSEKTNDSVPTADTSSTTVSPHESISENESTTQSPITESTQSRTETVNSAKNSAPESSVQSTSEEPEPVPVEFTDEDRELQKILSDLWEPTQNIHSWFNYVGVPTDLYPDADDWRLKIPEISFDDESCKWIPDNLRMTDSMFSIPTSKAGMEELFHKYFSAERTDNLLRRIPACELIERSDKTLTLKLKDDPEIYKNHNTRINFIEVDGRLYVPDYMGAKDYIDVETAKVTKKTNDTIEFVFLGTGDAGPDYKPQILNNTLLYSKYAQRGSIKLEDGIWKLHSWDDMHFPLRH